MESKLTTKNRYEKFDLIEYKNIRCTLLLYGKVNLNQREYFCLKCDPLKQDQICEECYQKCHFNCKSDGKHEESNEVLLLEKYVCECGLKKHFIKQRIKNKIINKNENKCYFAYIDTSLGNQYKYSCPNCYIENLCYICYKKCHFDCKNKIKKIDDKKNSYTRLQSYQKEGSLNKKNDNNDNNIYDKCMCDSNFHSNYLNTYTLLEDFSFINDFRYESIKFIWSVHVFNSLFDNKTILDKILFPLSIDVKQIKQCHQGTRLSSLTSVLSNNILHIKNNFYISKSFKSLFSIDFYMNLLESLIKTIEKEYFFIISLSIILFSIHIKSDYSKYKIFSVNDFILSNFNLRKVVSFQNSTKKHLFKKEIYEKYSIQNYIERFSILQANVLYLSFKLIKQKHRVNNIFILKSIYFCVKLNDMSYSSIITLISHLHGFSKLYKEYIPLVIKDILSMDENEIDDEFKKFEDEQRKILTYILKIILTLAIQINDYFHDKDKENNENEKEYKLNQYDFIDGRCLFEIYLNMVLFYFKKREKYIETPFYSSQENYKILYLSAQFLSLYSNKNNFYKKSNMRKVYKSILSSELSDVTSNMKIEYYQYKNTQYGKNYINSSSLKGISYLKASLYNINEDILQNIDLYFNNIITYHELFNSIERSLDDFSKIISSKIGNEKGKKGKKTDDDLSFYIIDYIKCINENLIIKDLFLIKDIVNLMILSSFDETITKIIDFDVENKYISMRIINKILSFLLLFTFSAEGIEYLLYGKVISRLITIFNKSPIGFIDTMYYYLLSIRFFKIKIKIENHFYIKPILNLICKYVINSKTLQYTKNSYDGLILYSKAMSILYSMSGYLEVNEIFQSYEKAIKYLYISKILSFENILHIYEMISFNNNQSYSRQHQSENESEFELNENENETLKSEIDEKENLRRVFIQKLAMRLLNETENEKNKNLNESNIDNMLKRTINSQWKGDKVFILHNGNFDIRNIFRLNRINMKKNIGFLKERLNEKLKKEVKFPSFSDVFMMNTIDINRIYIDLYDDINKTRESNENDESNKNDNYCFDNSKHSQDTIVIENEGIHFKILSNLYFDVIKIISESCINIKSNNSLSLIIQVIAPLNLLEYILSTIKESLKNRSIIFRFIRTFYISGDFIIKDKKKEEVGDNDYEQEQIIKISNIISSEIENFYVICWVFQDESPAIIKEYFNELIYLIKSTFDIVLFQLSLKQEIKLYLYSVLKYFEYYSPLIISLMTEYIYKSTFSGFDIKQYKYNEFDLYVSQEFDIIKGVFQEGTLYNSYSKIINDYINILDIQYYKNIRILSESIKEYTYKTDMYNSIYETSILSFYIKDIESNKVVIDFLVKYIVKINNQNNNLYMNMTLIIVNILINESSEANFYILKCLFIENYDWINQYLHGIEEFYDKFFPIFYSSNCYNDYIHKIFKEMYLKISLISELNMKNNMYIPDYKNKYIFTSPEKKKIDSKLIKAYIEKDSKQPAQDSKTSKSNKESKEINKISGKRETKTNSINVNDIINKNKSILRPDIYNSKKDLLKFKEKKKSRLKQINTKITNEDLLNINIKSTTNSNNHIEGSSNFLYNAEFNSNFKLENEKNVESIQVSNQFFSFDDESNISIKSLLFFFHQITYFLSKMTHLLNNDLSDQNKFIFIEFAYISIVYMEKLLIQLHEYKSILIENFNKFEYFLKKLLFLFQFSLKNQKISENNIQLLKIKHLILSFIIILLESQNRNTWYIYKFFIVNIEIENIFNEVIVIYPILWRYKYSKFNEDVGLDIKINDEYEDIQSYVNAYVYNKDFQESIFIKLLSSYYVYLQILIKVYSNMNIEKTMRKYLETSKEVFIIFSLMEKIIKKVDISTDASYLQREKKKYSENQTRSNNVNFYMENRKSQEYNENNNNIKHFKSKPYVSKFFLKPIPMFYLSNETKEKFVRKIMLAKSNSEKKVMINKKISSFLFEIIFNYTYYNDKIDVYILSMSYKLINFINFLMIVIVNLLIFFESNSLAYNIIISIQTLLLLVFIVIYIVKKMRLRLYKNLLKQRKFLFIINNNQIIRYLNNLNLNEGKDGREGKENKDYQKNPNKIKEMIVNNLLNDISKYELIDKIIFHSMIFNQEINLLLLSLLLNIIYFLTSSKIPISVGILFISSFSNTLKSIFKTIRSQINLMFIILFYCLALIWLFTVVGFYFSPSSYFLIKYEFMDSEMLPENQSHINICNSLLSCFIYTINYGLRYGEGIGANLRMISNRNKPQFIGRIISDMLFFILISGISSNLFLGVIIDGFNKFRDEIQKMMEKSCIICGMNKEFSRLKYIKYDHHIKTKHNIWNYISFINMLLLKDNRFLSKYEISIKKKILENDFSWIPFK